jgi:cysteine desulfurase
MEEWVWSADPGRVHTEGRMARAALEDARASVAALFGTRPRQVIFTSGATEAIAAATFGALRTAADSGAGAAVVMAAVEHSAVRESSALWASTVVTVPVDVEGRVSVDAVAEALESTPGARLVHCQLANHEVGTVQPVVAISEVCRRAGVLLHVDAAAAAGYIPVEFDSLGVDLMSVSAHKMGGPPGVGALLVRRGLRIPPLLRGGAQERARRAGMENVGAAAGFGAVAASLLEPIGDEELTRLELESVANLMRIEYLKAAVSAVPGVTIYGPATPGARLPHLLCIGIEGVEAEPVLIGLDRAGVAAHSGSSCSSEDLEPSPVLQAMGVDGERSLRFSVGWSTSDAEVERTAEAFVQVVEGLRRLGEA